MSWLLSKCYFCRHLEQKQCAQASSSCPGVRPVPFESPRCPGSPGGLAAGPVRVGLCRSADNTPALALGPTLTWISHVTVAPFLSSAALRLARSGSLVCKRVLQKAAAAARG